MGLKNLCVLFLIADTSGHGFLTLTREELD